MFLVLFYYTPSKELGKRNLKENFGDLNITQTFDNLSNGPSLPTTAEYHNRNLIHFSNTTPRGNGKKDCPKPTLSIFHYGLRCISRRPYCVSHSSYYVFIAFQVPQLCTV